jgi:hypothetical protein
LEQVAAVSNEMLQWAMFVTSHVAAEGGGYLNTLFVRNKTVGVGCEVSQLLPQWDLFCVTVES